MTLKWWWLTLKWWWLTWIWWWLTQHDASINITIIKTSSESIESIVLDSRHLLKLKMFNLNLWKNKSYYMNFTHKYLSYRVFQKSVPEPSKFGCRIIFWIIYLSKSFHKNSQKKLYYVIIINICKYIIFLSIILNVHNDPCFEDKSSSLTLKCRPVHFSENSCICLYKLYKKYKAYVVWLVFLQVRVKHF